MAKDTGKEPAPEKIPYHEQVANKLIEQLKAGTAPWQKPWAPGSLSLPHNPVSGARYKGSNVIWLEMQGRGDPRWMTYKQAVSVEAQVRKGEKGTLVQYWKFTDQIPAKDDRGKPLVDQEGQKIYRTVQLERPKVFSATVFNAQQIDGLPPLETKAPAWDRHDRAEAVLQASGAEIRHDQADRAFYRPATDRIHLPARDSFPSADTYYSTALHEVGHWTGHPARLDRDLAHPFGSEGYAKEELRAEIASLMIGDELGIGHDPGQHASYVQSWIRALQEDPKEILRAARDADRITSYVIGLERERGAAVDQEPAQPPAAVAAPTVAPDAQRPQAPTAPPKAPEHPGSVAEPTPVPPTPVPDPKDPAGRGAEATSTGTAAPTVAPTEERKRKSMSPAGARFVTAIERRDLKAALDVLKPLSVLDAKVAALDAGMSIGSPKTKAAFFADIQGQLLKAVRAPTASPIPAAAPVLAKEPQARPVPRAPREALARER